MKYTDLRKLIQSPYFTLQDIRLNGGILYPYQITQWKKRELIEQIKRGVYLFTDRKSDISKEEIAFILYEPSYISVEYALKYYGFIPDMVYAITSITTRTTRRFTNSLGSFIYQHVTPRLFFGYTSHNTKFGKYLFAEPEKAVLDYLYLHQENFDTMDDLEEARLNSEELQNRIDAKKLREYARAFQSPKIDRLIDLLDEYAHS